jgi:hypothetical protein
MARVLTAMRSRVAPEHQAEYVATVADLARRLAGRGQHLWLFRRRDHAEEFLEFSEGKDDASHRRAGPADATEQELEARLGALARYDGTRQECWDEVPLHST